MRLEILCLLFSIFTGGSERDNRLGSVQLTVEKTFSTTTEIRVDVYTTSAGGVGQVWWANSTLQDGQVRLTNSAVCPRLLEDLSELPEGPGLNFYLRGISAPVAGGGAPVHGPVFRVSGVNAGPAGFAMISATSSNGWLASWAGAFIDDIVHCESVQVE